MPLTNIVTDLANRADNALTIGTADTGQVWANQWGVCGIKTNQFYPVSLGGGFPPFYPCAVVPCGYANGEIKLDLTALLGQAGVIWRWTAGGNGFLMSVDLNTISILKVVNFAGTSIYNSNIPGPRPTGLLRIVLSGNNHDCYYAGNLEKSFTDAYNATATNHGVMFGSPASNPRSDNFYFDTNITPPSPDILHQKRALLMGLG